MERPLPADLVLDLDTHRLLLLGTRQFPDAERLERALGPPERRLRRVSPSPFDFEAVTPLPAERAVLASCARSVPLGELLALPHPRPQLARAAYALLVGGLIDDAPARVAAPPIRPSPEAPAVAAEPPAPAPAEADLTPLPPPPQTPEEAERTARGLLEKGFASGRSRSCTRPWTGTPRRGACVGMLAMTRGRESGFDPELEKLFLSLLEKDRQDAELRYALASWYRRGAWPPARSSSSGSCCPPTPATPPPGATSGSSRRGRPAGADAPGSAERAGSARGRDAERPHGVEVGALAGGAARAGVELPVLDPHVARLRHTARRRGRRRSTP